MRLALSMSADVLGEARQRFEDANVVLVVGAHLKAIALRDDERDLEDVDRVEAEAFAIERRLRVDRLRGGVEVQCLDEERGDLALQGGVGERHEDARKCGEKQSSLSKGGSPPLFHPGAGRLDERLVL